MLLRYHDYHMQRNHHLQIFLLFLNLMGPGECGACHSDDCRFNPGSQLLSKSGPEIIKLFSCSTEHEISLLIKVKMPTIFMNRKNSILCLSEPKKAEFLDIFILMSMKKD